MNFDIKTPREFDAGVRRIETTDRLHADSINPQLSTLINNDMFLREQADTAADHQANNEIHVTKAQKDQWNAKAEKTKATTGTDGLMAASDKAKLDGISSGAQPNQNAVSGIKSGNTTVTAATPSSTVELAAGNNIAISADNSTKRITIGTTGLEKYALAADVTTQLANKANKSEVVPNTRTINAKPLSSNVSLTAADVHARPDTWTPTAAEVGAAPSARKINGKALTTDIALTAADVHARADTWTPTAAEVGAAPSARKINGKALTADIALTAADVHARPDTWVPTAVNVGAVPSSRKINGQALTADITLTAADVRARADTWTPTAAEVGAAPSARKINSKALTADITLTAADVHARPDTWTPTAANVGAVPSARKINGQALTADVTLTKADLGLGNVENTADKDKNVKKAETAAEAAKLQTARTINGVLFDGTSNITISASANGGAATTASKLQTARKIALSGGATGTATSFDGSADITIPVSGLNMSNATAGTLSVARGGTGATSAAAACRNLGAISANSPVFSGSISMGRKSNTTVGDGSFAVGSDVTASASYSHAEGYGAIASEEYAHAEGGVTVASGYCSHAAGMGTIANESSQTVVGRYNVKSSASSYTYDNIFVVGCGTGDSARKNAFRVNKSGSVYGGTYYTSGADYAEYFEWQDGNPNAEDRIGCFVTIDGEKIRLANADDPFILGVVSGNGSVVGNAYDDTWQGMEERDAFGRLLFEEVEIAEAKDRSKSTQAEPIKQRQPRLNPNYDSSKPYIPRSQRPEWDAVGCLGRLIVYDNGACKENGACACGVNGHAVPSVTGWRVLKRIDADKIMIWFR